MSRKNHLYKDLLDFLANEPKVDTPRILCFGTPNPARDLLKLKEMTDFDAYLNLLKSVYLKNE